MKTPNPCRDCEFRHQGCHGSCEQYKDWQQIHAAELEEERRRKAEHYDFIGYQADWKKRYERSKRHRNSNK